MSFPFRRAASVSASGAAIGPEPRYADVATALGGFIRRQMEEKSLPGFAISLVDNQNIVWATGFGYADPERKIPEAAETVFRAGAISEIFTDIAVMQLVERGKLDLDAPITRYIPDFHPRNPFSTPVTLRQLMTHRSGLVREPPVGNIFDSSSPTLAATAISLNRTSLVYWPSTHAKYSNAGIAVAGYAVERQSGRPFAGYMRQAVLTPMGMNESSFAPAPALAARMAKGRVWTYDVGSIPAPTFPLGVAPAAGLYCTAADLGRFLEILFASGRGQGDPILRRPTLEEMWTPQFASGAAETGYGLGFVVSQLDGHRMVEHAGGIYGFSAQISALPEEKLGVVTMTNVGGAEGVTRRVAQLALRMMLAEQRNKRLPKIPETTAVPVDRAQALAGRYGALSNAFDLVAREGRLFLSPVGGGIMVQLRQAGRSLIEDGRLGYGLELTPISAGVRIGHTIFPRIESPKAGPVPERWKGLIGDYGWSYGRISIRERNGRLTALAGWFEYNPLREISSNVFQFPASGIYDGERAVFTRSAGVASQLQIGGVVFPRLTLPDVVSKGRSGYPAS